MRKVEIIVPCYNEEIVLPEFTRRLFETIDGCPDLDWAVTFIDDGSADGTLAYLNRLSAQNERVGVYALSRNYGHQIALSAGIDVASADAAILMDSDLQHPPEMIPDMIAKWQEGYDIVSTVRKGTEDASCWKRFTSCAFYKIINRMSDVSIPAGAADFCLLSGIVLNALRRMPEKHRFLRGMIAWLGFRRAFIPYTAPGRAAGESKYTTIRMISMALDGIMSFSAAPLRLVTRMGLTVLLLGIIYFIYILVSFHLSGDVVQGWTSVICTVLILCGLQLLALGVSGEYIARIYEESKGRPIYFFKQIPSPNEL